MNNVYVFKFVLIYECNYEIFDRFIYEIENFINVKEYRYFLGLLFI